MKRSGTSVAALAVAAVMLVGAGGCGSGGANGTPATATSSKLADPKERLAASTAAYDTGNYAADFTMPGGGGQAIVDAAKKQVYMKIGLTEPAFGMEMLVVEPDAFAKLNLGDLGPMAGLPGSELFTGKKWMHVDRTRLKDSDRIPISGDADDALGLKKLLSSAQGVQASGERKYTGTVDLTAADADSLISADEDVVKALGDKAKTVPFTATVDDQGRLAELAVDVPAAGDNPAHQLKVTLTGYGTAAVPAKPAAGEFVEAPDNVYDALGT